jgi:hypothetical protein
MSDEFAPIYISTTVKGVDSVECVNAHRGEHTPPLTAVQMSPN